MEGGGGGGGGGGGRYTITWEKAEGSETDGGWKKEVTDLEIYFARKA